MNRWRTAKSRYSPLPRSTPGSKDDALASPIKELPNKRREIERRTLTLAHGHSQRSSSFQAPMEGAKTEVPQETVLQQSTKAPNAPMTHKLKSQVLLGWRSRRQQELFPRPFIGSTDRAAAARTGDGTSGFSGEGERRAQGSTVGCFCDFKTATGLFAPLFRVQSIHRNLLTNAGLRVNNCDKVMCVGAHGILILPRAAGLSSLKLLPLNSFCPPPVSVWLCL
jgi:hypothetical protein